MPVVQNGETYYNASEAAHYLGISRPTFYANVASEIQAYTLGAFKRNMYRQSDLDRFRGARPVERNGEEKE